jgi:hypothetical protein
VPRQARRVKLRHEASRVSVIGKCGAEILHSVQVDTLALTVRWVANAFNAGYWASKSATGGATPERRCSQL